MVGSSEEAPPCAFAPATVGNVAVGFDILGFGLVEPGDRITVRRIDAPTVRVGSIGGIEMNLPERADENTATVGLVQMVEDFGLDFGFEVDIEKGIPLGSGMGGSAASAVGAVVAASEWIDEPMADAEILQYALLGESVASGDLHGDNVSPCLYGGLTLTRSLDPIDVVSIPVPEGMRCVLAHPHRTIETERARSVIPGELPLKNYVEQSANLAGFIAGCYRSDLDLIERSMADMLIEPHRAPLIPGFRAVCEAALAQGALGCSISGAGPSVFAWCHPPEKAGAIEEAMAEAFEAKEIPCTTWVSRIDEAGASLVPADGDGASR